MAATYLLKIRAAMAHLDDAMVALGGVVRHLDDGVDNVNQIIAIVKEQIQAWGSFSSYSPALLLAIEGSLVILIGCGIALCVKQLRK